MKLKRFIIFLALVLITGCGVSKEQALDLAKQTFNSSNSTAPKEPNSETNTFSYYLPVGLSVEEKAENNLILRKGNQLFLIFSNPAEDHLSRVNYEQDQLIEEKAILSETKEAKDKFSYLMISPYEKGKYKIIVGMGGEKGTTLSDLDNLNDSVATLLEIIHSINY